MIVTETPAESAQPGRTPRQKLAAFGLWLLQPATPLPERARLLSGLLLLLILLIIVGTSASYLALASSNPLPGLTVPITALGTALLVAAYWLNRRGRYHLATGLTVGASAVGVWVVVIANRNGFAANPFIILYVLLSVLLGSLLLSARVTALIAGAHLLAIALAPRFIPGFGPIVQVNIFMLICFTTLLTVVGTSLRQRSLGQLQAQSRELRESEQRFRLLFAASPDAVLLMDPHDPEHPWRIVDCNEVAVRMYGYPREELIGRPLDFLNLTPRAAEVREARLEVMRQGNVLHIETVRRHKAGHTFPVEVSATLATFGGSELVIGIQRDITERKRAEEALRASEEYYRLLFDSNPLPMWVYAVQGLAFLAVNDAAVEHYGYARAEFLGMTIHDIRSLEESTRLGLNLSGPRQSQQSSGPWQHRLKDGRLVDVDIISHDIVFDAQPARLVLALDITQRLAAEQQVERQFRRLSALRAIDNAIGASLDIHLTLEVLLEQVVAQLGIDAAAILLLNPHLQTLEYTASHGFHSHAIQHTRLRLGDGYAGRAALERRTVHVANVVEAGGDLSRALLLADEAVVAYYGVPLVAKGEVKGVLEVFHRSPLDPDAEWLGFLESLAGQAAIAIDNAQLFDSLQRSNTQLALAYDATIEGWSRALDLRDRETEGHTQRVADITVRLALAFGLREDELEHMRWGALLHDIGKMGVPDDILLKPGPLSADEWVVMKQHPSFAYDMLSPIHYLRAALDIPYCHHEKWDGTGYPRGLKGEHIPLAARIFAVVDVWDALRSDRPYRRAWPEAQVREHIRSLSGTHFDPQVVSVALESAVLVLPAPVLPAAVRPD
jgi:PAS domain S-box-containing protein